MRRGAALISAMACIVLSGIDAQARDMPLGYLLVQALPTFTRSVYGAVSTEEEADRILSALPRQVDGIELYTLFYDKESLLVHRKVAELTQTHGFDAWATTWNLVSRISIGAFGALPPAYHAKYMNERGEILTAVVDGVPLFDVLNRDAVDWFLREYGQRYLKPLKGVLSGLFLNEDTIPWLGNQKSGTRYDYWSSAVYSAAVLKAWRTYCVLNDVRENGKVVTAFPVHRNSMVAQGNGATAYFTGYDVPQRIEPGQVLKKLPRARGVWHHWQTFLASHFLDTWIAQIAKLANELNSDNPNWFGVVYFGLHVWSLPYESIEEEGLTVPSRHRWGAWGLQRGIDLEKLGRLDGIRAVVCETYPPVEANLELFIKEYQRIVLAGGRQFGLMVHRDDSWKLDQDEEERRWELVRKFAPTMLVRHPLRNMMPWNSLYSEAGEELFLRGLDRYRKMRR